MSYIKPDRNLIPLDQSETAMIKLSPVLFLTSN